METPQRAVTLPAHEVVMHGAARGQVLGQGTPLATCAEDVEHRIEHLAQINPALPRPALRDIHERTGQLPFGVGHVRGIPQALAVVGVAGLGLPHRRASSKAATPTESQPTLLTQLSPGPALRARSPSCCCSTSSRATCSAARAAPTPPIRRRSTLPTGRSRRVRRQIAPDLRRFFYLPFMHSEELADQERSVALNETSGDADAAQWARHHRDLIARFGRFPHRNAVLGPREHGGGAGVSG